MRNKSSFRFFYLRLAVTNMQKNGGIYLPWLLAGTFVAGLFYVVSAVGEMSAIMESIDGNARNLNEVADQLHETISKFKI